MNEQAPDTQGPVGRIRRLANGVAKRFTRGDQGTALRIEKRDGFAVLASQSTQVIDPSTGVVDGTKSMSSAPQLLAAWKNKVVMAFAEAPYVLGESEGKLYSPPVTVLPQVQREKKIALQDGSVSAPSSARIGTRTMHVWMGTGGSIVWYKIVDDDGTVTLKDTAVFVGAPACARVAADGNQRFWLVIQNTTSALIGVSSGDVNGVGLGVFNQVQALSSSQMASVQRDAGAVNRIFVAQRDDASGNLKLIRYTWNGSSVVDSAVVIGGALAGTGSAMFLRNDTGDGNLYIATSNGAGPFDHRAYQITTPAGTPAIGHTYNVSLAAANVAAQTTGFVAATGAKDITVLLGFPDPSGNNRLSFTEIRTVTFAGVTLLLATKRSLMPVSEPLVIDGSYYDLLYHHSDPAAFGSVPAGQSTFYLVRLPSGQVCGEIQRWRAYADWQTVPFTTGVFWNALSVPNVDARGSIHLALAYQAFSQDAISTIGDVFLTQRHVVDVVGIKDWSIGPDFGQALDEVDALMLPGMRALSFAGFDFTEDGISFVPEPVPSGPTLGAGGNLTTGQIYQYVFVWETTDAAGNRIRGPAGPPINVNLTGGNTKVTWTGYMHHATLRTNVILGVYRTALLGPGVMSTVHYKVSGTLVNGAYTGPTTFNSDSSTTWTFVDTMSDASAQLGEQLYVDSGKLDRFGAPPYSVGCRAFGRAFVVAPDNSIWFSGQKSEGDAYWWNPLLRITLPTTERVKAMAVLDDFLLVLCEDSAVFRISSQPFPDDTGSGSFPSPTLLPFTNGCTGWAISTSDGVMYTSPQGGIWMITRDLRNVFIGAPVQETSKASTFAGVASDDDQRVAFLSVPQAGPTSLLVWDQVSACWYVWQTLGGFDTAAALTTHKGRFAYVGNDFGNWGLLRQTPGLTSDGGFGFTVAIQRALDVEFIRLGGIRNYKRLWNVQLYGESLGDQDLQVFSFIDDDLGTQIDSYTWTPPASGKWVFELPPSRELITSISYRIADAFPRSPSTGTAGTALELMAFYVGLEKGLGRLPAASRIKPG
ncbi:MAG TPA: hypothetical protein VI384_04495 [Candidatus Dormibacteraeota bacterium]